VGNGDVGTRKRRLDMADMRSFKALWVWRNAMDSAMIVFELAKRFPVEKIGRMT
jgi:hypothetical protein